MSKKSWAWIAAILVVAATTRLVFAVLVWTPTAKSPDQTISVMYVRSAYLLATGHGYAQAIPDSPAYQSIEGSNGLKQRARNGTKLTLSNGAIVPLDGLYPEMVHPPGWSVVASALHRLSGLPVWLPMQILGGLVDVAACGLAYWLTYLLLGSYRIARLSGLFYALFPPLAYASIRLQPIAFMSFFVLLETVLFVLACRSQGRRQILLFAACGLLAGVSAYFRPDYLLLAPFLVIGLFWTAMKAWKILAIGIGMAALSLVVLTPWTVRNYDLAGRIIVTSTSVGATLVSGLGAVPNPWGFGPSDVDRAKEAAQRGIPTPFNAEADAYFRGVFWDAVKKHPGTYLKQLLRRSWMPLAPPHDWGLVSKFKARPFHELRRQGAIFANLIDLAVAHWPRIISGALMLIGHIGLVLMYLRERKARPVIITLFLVWAYAAFSHIFTLMVPFYLLPAAFVPLIGLAYLCSGRLRGVWKVTRSPRRPVYQN